MNYSRGYPKFSAAAKRSSCYSVNRVSRDVATRIEQAYIDGEHRNLRPSFYVTTFTLVSQWHIYRYGKTAHLTRLVK